MPNGFEKNINKKGNRQALAELFDDPAIRKNIEMDILAADHLHDQIVELENYQAGVNIDYHIQYDRVRHAKAFDPRTYYRLQTVPGIGKVLALTILYEIGNIDRFPDVQHFCSYSRLVKCPKESAGQLYGYGGQKMGNAHLKWAFSEAMALLMRQSQEAKDYVARLEKKHGKSKAMSILAHKLGRAVYTIIKRKDAFDVKYFFIFLVISFGCLGEPRAYNWFIVREYEAMASRCGKDHVDHYLLIRQCPRFEWTTRQPS